MMLYQHKLWQSKATPTLVTFIDIFDTHRNMNKLILIFRGTNPAQILKPRKTQKIH